MSSVPSVYPILHNCRMYAEQRIQSRAGLSKVTGTPFDQLLVHTMRRLNDKTSASFARIVGAGTKLYLASNPVAIDTGYSGNPLSMVPMRPDQSPQPWMYVADSNKMRKVLATGVNYQMGIAPPLLPPVVEFGLPAVTPIDDFNVVGSWVPGGTAGALSIVSRSSFNCGFILYDNLTGPGWACLDFLTFPGPGSSLRAGQRIKLTQASPSQSEVTQIQELIPQWLYTNLGTGYSGATIQSIVYDSGTTGLCTVTLSIPPTVMQANVGLVPEMNAKPRGGPIKRRFSGNEVASRALTTNALGLRNDALIILASLSVSEFVRILSISTNTNNTVSFRCSTVNTHASGENVASYLCGRAYLANTYPNGLGHTVAVATNALQSTIGAGTGTISEITPLDLSYVQGQDLSIQEDDIIHISFRIDNMANLTEFRLLFDVDSSVNDFQHSYYFKSWSAADIQGALLGNTTIQQARSTSYSSAVVNQNIGDTSNAKIIGPVLIADAASRRDPADRLLGPGSNYPTSSKMDASGLSAWVELTCRVSDLTLVGTDSSRSLANTQGVRAQITVSASAVCAISSLWIGGCYGSDIGTVGAPYLYCYRGRSSFTGAVSLASPATRSGISPHRQAVEVDMVQHPDPQVDVLDVYRWGGTLPQWTYVGTTQNTSSPVFQDVFSDTSIANSPLLDTDKFQPFPTIDLPRNGMCNVTGTTVTWASGAQFNPRWYPGSEIVINGIVYNLYQQPSSATVLQIVQNAGTQTGVPFQIKQATLLAQPLASFWGPYQQGTGLICFACGDTYQPGVLFLTNPNDMDSASDVLQIEITSPSEPLMNGCMYDGLSYIWSTERMWSLYPSFGSGYVIEAGTLLPAEGTNLFVPLDVPNGKGLFCEFCIAVGSKMWFRARDGIYETTGGAPNSITGAELSLLFPHDNQPGQPVTVGTFTIYPPDDTLPNFQKLSSYNSFLYYDYQDTQGNKTTLVYSEVTGAWTKDDYTPQIASHYGEEGQGVNSMLLGGVEGNIYQAAGAVDGTGLAFPFEARMPQMSELVGGYQQPRDCFLGLMDNATSNLVINVDGTDNLIALPSVAGVYKRIYQPLPAVKGKLLAFALLGTSPFLGIFQRDCEFRAKTWGDAEYSKINPFGSLGRAAAPKVT